MPFDVEQFSFKSLKRDILEGYHIVVPFVGSGISSFGDPDKRLPLWSELVKRLEGYASNLGVFSSAEKAIVEQKRNGGELVAALDILVNSIGEKHFRIFIESEFDTDKKQVPPAVTELICIGWSLIVTTNLDGFIEKEWHRKRNEILDVVTHTESTKLAQAISGTVKKPVLAKIHGSVEKFESWILSSKHYENLLNNDKYRLALQSLFLRTIFFIGYGISDQDLDLLLHHIRSIFPAGVGRFYALLADTQKGTDRVNALIKDYGIEPVWYKYDSSRKNYPDCGHGEVAECLHEIVKDWSTTSQEIHLNLKYFPELDSGFVGRTGELEDLHNAILGPVPINVQVIGFGGEGKTSLVQQFLHFNKKPLSKRYKSVFGITFYRGDVSRFISDAYTTLIGENSYLSLGMKVHELCDLFLDKNILLVFDGLEVMCTGKVGQKILLIGGSKYVETTLQC